MNKIEYEIKLNESGRPCIDLPTEHEDKPEDKFFAIEIARYILQNVYARRSADFDKNTSEKLELTISMLGQIGDEMAVLIWDSMEGLGEMSMMVNNKYHIRVATIEERDNLNTIGILQGDKIFRKQDGLKVLVTDEMKIYELKIMDIEETWIELE